MMDEIKAEAMDVITRVASEGQKVVALALKYPFKVDGKFLSNGTYSIEATHGNKKFTRKVREIYISHDKLPGRKSNDGEYVVIELEDNPDSLTYAYQEETETNERLPFSYSVYRHEKIRADDTGLENGVQTGEVNLVVDDFHSETFVGEAGKLKYRFFVPEDHKLKKLPLVLFLHGAGETGSSNIAQLILHKGAITWAEPESQKEQPVYVLAPQLPKGQFWTSGIMKESVLELLDYIKTVYPVDEQRIYITGLSRGGRGTWRLIQENPHLFAAAIPVCGTGDAAKAEVIKTIPVWAFHSADDSVVWTEGFNPEIPVPDGDPYTHGTSDMFQAMKKAGIQTMESTWPGNLERKEAEKAAFSLMEEAKKLGIRHLYTIYQEETTPVSPHHSWIPTYENIAVKKWLFQQRRK